jgi:glycyl-tRNA synthetase
LKKEPLVERARKVFEDLRKHWNVEYDESGSIGKRYRRVDEIGAPFAVTVDFETDGVTIRERDSMKQHRVGETQLVSWFQSKLGSI